MLLACDGICGNLLETFDECFSALFPGENSICHIFLGRLTWSIKEIHLLDAALCDLDRSFYPWLDLWFQGDNGKKWMCVDRMLEPPSDIELLPWPSMFKVKYWKKIRLPWMGWSIDWEWEWCSSIWSRAHFVTLDFDLTHNHDFLFPRSNFKVYEVVYLDWESRLGWNEKDVSRFCVEPTIWPWAMALTSDFPSQITPNIIPVRGKNLSFITYVRL